MGAAGALYLCCHFGDLREDIGVAAAAVMRLRVLFAGRVQGVGFRATTCELARGYQLTGCVRNLADGRVELEAQGIARTSSGTAGGGGGAVSAQHSATR